MSEAELEFRREFEAWFRESAAKDIDGVMSHVADDVVSYEHDAPLEYRGADGVREVCLRGFEAAQGEFTWSIPDLTVVVRGDIAVTWGLNHMHAEGGPDGTYDSWSRGTRVFQRRDGRWTMVHQHVSYPYDPQTGEARTDLSPDGLLGDHPESGVLRTV